MIDKDKAYPKRIPFLTLSYSSAPIFCEIYVVIAIEKEVTGRIVLKFDHFINYKLLITIYKLIVYSAVKVKKEP